MTKRPMTSKAVGADITVGRLTVITTIITTTAPLLQLPVLIVTNTTSNSITAGASVVDTVTITAQVIYLFMAMELATALNGPLVATLSDLVTSHKSSIALVTMETRGRLELTE